MDTSIRNWLMAAALAAAMPAGAADDPALGERLQAARERLEAAAREVAELSAEAYGPELQRRFEIFLPQGRRAMLGINLGSASGGVVEVQGVSPGGPAAKAGVRAGDVVVAIDEKSVATGRELVRVMEDVEPGQKVALDLRRDGKPVRVTVEARPLDHLFFAAPGMPVPPVPPLPAIEALPRIGAPGHGGMHWLLDGWGDAEFVTLTPGLGRYFGTEQGVLVARAPEDAALGLRDGDVIVSIGGREPQDARHAMRILRSYQPGESVELGIMRDRRAQTVSGQVPEHTGHDVLRRREMLRRKLVPPPAPPAPAGAPART